MLSQALEGRARTHPGGPASASLAIPQDEAGLAQAQLTSRGPRSSRLGQSQGSQQPSAPTSKGGRRVTRLSPPPGRDGGISGRREAHTSPSARGCPRPRNAERLQPHARATPEREGRLREGRGPQFPASGASEVISQGPGVGSCASLCVGESLVRKMERGPLGGHLSVLWSGVTERGLHPLSRGLSSRCRGQRALVARVSGAAFPTVARPVENESMAEGSPAKHQFVHFKELLFFQSEET